MDVYGPILEKALFPAFEAVRGRPTVPLLRFLQGSERWSLDALQELQGGLLRRLVRHAYAHTRHYRAVLDARGLTPEDIATVEELRRLPLLDRDRARETLEARTATGPPRWGSQKATRGTMGTPVVKYNAEARLWREAVRWRGYGWAGYHIGMRALHYWGNPPGPVRWLARKKLELGRKLTRDLYLDCIVRSEPALENTVRELERFEPEVIVAYAAGAAALARFINQHRRARTWRDIPVIVGAERLWPYERGQIQIALGPAFETYGCREVMLVGAECEQHDGMHTSMENLIVEIVVCEADGTVRAAAPGERGLVAVTDLHNLACPMIRYIPGDVAVARSRTPCACGRGLARIGPIEGRVT